MTSQENAPRGRGIQVTAVDLETGEELYSYTFPGTGRLAAFCCCSCCSCCCWEGPARPIPDPKPGDTKPA